MVVIDKVMSVSSPGQRATLWSASIPPQDLPVEWFLRSGASSVPVALVPNNGGIIRMKNPKTIQSELRAISSHFQQITEVRQFGRGGILCCSPDQTCVQDLLKCTNFATQPVRSFIPPHLACCKGLVRGVDISLTPPEILEIFSAAGVVSVYRCTRLVDNKRVPTETIIATFAGTARPSEIKAWPLIYRVEPLAPRPLQCLKCWRYGHSANACRSSARCRLCGEEHDANDCTSQEQSCCLCNANHAADYSNCPARSKEIQVIEIIERRRCSRREALEEIQSRTQGYAGVTARQSFGMDQSLPQAITAAIEKAMEKALEKILLNLSESLATVISTQLAGISQTLTNSAQNTAALLATSPKYQTPLPSNSVDSVRPSTSAQVDHECHSDSDSLGNRDVDMDTRVLKRTRSPTNKMPRSPNSKTKKCVKESLTRTDFLKDSILEQAVAAACLPTT